MKNIVKFDLDKLLRSKGTKDIEVIVRGMLLYPGDSYVLEYNRLLRKSRNLKCDGTHLLNYIVLASYRSYFDLLKGDSTLDAMLCPMSNKDIIENPFLNRYGNRIHFMLET